MRHRYADLTNVDVLVLKTVTIKEPVTVRWGVGGIIILGENTIVPAHINATFQLERI